MVQAWIKRMEIKRMKRRRLMESKAQHLALQIPPQLVLQNQVLLKLQKLQPVASEKLQKLPNLKQPNLKEIGTNGF